ncbi:MAG: hypothetical protein NVS3B25_09810 [Hymenobacter sp.]
MPLLLLAVLSFLKAHWRPFAVAGVLLLAFLGGRCSAPKPTVTVKTEVRTEYKDRIVTVEKKVEAEVKTQVVYRDRIVTRPDGTKIETKTEVDSKVDEHQTDDINTVKVSSGKADSTAVTLQNAAPRWNISLGVAVPLKYPNAPAWVLMQANYRIVGPLTIGGWSLFDTKWGNPALGVSVGVSF